MDWLVVDLKRSRACDVWNVRAEVVLVHVFVWGLLDRPECGRERLFGAGLIRQSAQFAGKQSTPGGIRTPNPRFRRPMLYPVELRVHWRWASVCLILSPLSSLDGNFCPRANTSASDPTGSPNCALNRSSYGPAEPACRQRAQPIRLMPTVWPRNRFAGEPDRVPWSHNC